MTWIKKYIDPLNVSPWNTLLIDSLEKLVGDHDFNIIKLKTNGIEMGPGSWIMNLNTIKSDYFKQFLLNGGNYE
jgi:hypothetical protein